jgi:predicted N-formylglutamate amidohydrolase
VFWPYHEALGHAWARARAHHSRPVFLALHSFTRTLDGVRRPWDAGTIWNEGWLLSNALLSEIGRDGSLTLGSNEPYSGRDGVFTVDRHSFGSGAPGCGLEIADDRIASRKDRSAWADRLAGALTAIAGVGAAT